MTGAAPPSAVTYIGLPISSGGAHSLGRMSRRVAYERAFEFLRACTEPVGDIGYSFRTHDVPELGRVLRLERELQRRFADPRVIPRLRVGDALDFLDDIDPQPTNRFGMAPIWFRVTSRFLILDPATGAPLAGQDPGRFGGVEYEGRVPLGSSGLRLILHNQAQLGIELCIPDASDDVIQRVVPWLQEHLPFKLSPKHWRAWSSTKSGSFKARKMSAPNTDRSASHDVC
jgi:hypothetical protein